MKDTEKFEGVEKSGEGYATSLCEVRKQFHLAPCRSHAPDDRARGSYPV